MKKRARAERMKSMKKRRAGNLILYRVCKKKLNFGKKETSRFEVVCILDQSLPNQFSQAQLRSLKSKENGQVTAGDLPPLPVNLKPFIVIFMEEEIKEISLEPETDEGSKLDFEAFLMGRAVRIRWI